MLTQRNAGQWRNTQPAIHEARDAINDDVWSMPRRQCPPCTQECRQGRDCDAVAEQYLHAPDCGNTAQGRTWDRHLPALVAVSLVTGVALLMGWI